MNETVTENTEIEKIYLLFTAGDEKYVLDSSQVKEIVRNHEVFPVPFLPEYLRGVLNYYGKPYSIVDFSRLMGGSFIENKVFMILNSDEEVALQVSAVHDFKKASDVTEILSDENENRNSHYYFKGFVSIDDDHANNKNDEASSKKIKAFVVDIENVLSKIKSDLVNNSVN